MRFANVRLHTYFSDGLISPMDLAKRVVVEPGVEYFALTGHDTLPAIKPVFRSLKRLEKPTPSNRISQVLL